MMVRRAITAGFASGAILASASPALAQGWTGGPMRIAPLIWKDGLDRKPTNIRPALR